MSKKSLKDTYISDLVDVSEIEQGAFNLISSGCGTGKTDFCAKKLCEGLNILPSEALLVTSRALTVDQLDQEDGVKKFRWDDAEIVKYWNGEDRSDLIEEYKDSPLIAMTYDKLVRILTHMGSRGRFALENIKVVVFDECHCMVSDMFIQDIEVVKFWMRDMVIRKEKIVVGLTATPEMVVNHMNTRDIPIKLLNEKPFIKYKANRLKCILAKQLPDLLTKELTGKSIVMCRTVKQCQDLCAVIPGSTMLVSRSNDEYTKEMDTIRWHIVHHKELPLTIPGTNDDLNVLIATSTIREGFSLAEVSNVRNVVCYYVDEMNITQLVGRCRYNVDCLVVADAGQWHTQSRDAYKEKYIDLYRDFIDNGSSDWFKTISHIVNCKFTEIERGVSLTERKNAIRKKNVSAFLSFLDESGYIFRDGQIGAKRMRSEDKKIIINEAKSLKLFDGPPSKYTWDLVLELLTKNGYEVRESSSTEKADSGSRKNYRYKEIWENNKK